MMRAKITALPFDLTPASIFWMRPEHMVRISKKSAKHLAVQHTMPRPWLVRMLPAFRKLIDRIFPEMPGDQQEIRLSGTLMLVKVANSYYLRSVSKVIDWPAVYQIKVTNHNK